MRSLKIHFGLGASLLAVVSLLVFAWVSAAARRLDQSAGQAPAVALAGVSDEEYCSGELKTILRRVLTSCGLLRQGGMRGCQPLEAKSVAAMASGDFNALFLPLKHRTAILQFERDSSDLDPASQELLERTFADQGGASYFLVVSRASPEGSVLYNRELSQRRADTVLNHLQGTFADPDLEEEVGLLWLGEEFAQLDEEFCQWPRSHPEDPCTTDDLNRSAFIAWIDCRL